MTSSKTTTNNDVWDRRFRSIANAIGRDYSAGVNKIADGTDQVDPFRVLVSTIISLRTRDEVTFAASERLLQRAGTPQELLSLDTAEIESLVYPAGFYRNKAKNLRNIAQILVNDHNGAVPATVDQLTALPGVGRKTANLVLGIAFSIPAICVDIHVHRIPNRLGWIRTSTPEQTERALMGIVPVRFWIPMNEWLVGFGQNICTPQSPRCSRCPLQDECKKNGVHRQR